MSIRDMMHFRSPPSSNGNVHYPIYYRYMSLNLEICVVDEHKSQNLNSSNGDKSGGEHYHHLSVMSKNILIGDTKFFCQIYSLTSI